VLRWRFRVFKERIIFISYFYLYFFPIVVFSCHTWSRDGVFCIDMHVSVATSPTLSTMPAATLTARRETEQSLELRA